MWIFANCSGQAGGTICDPSRDVSVGGGVSLECPDGVVVEAAPLRLSWGFEGVKARLMTASDAKYSGRLVRTAEMRRHIRVVKAQEGKGGRIVAERASRADEGKHGECPPAWCRDVGRWSSFRYAPAHPE